MVCYKGYVLAKCAAKKPVLTKKNCNQERFMNLPGKKYNTLVSIKKAIFETIKKIDSNLQDNVLERITLNLNIDSPTGKFGDLSCNAAMILAKALSQNPRALGEKIKEKLEQSDNEVLRKNVKTVEIAGPGFINIFLNPEAWNKISVELYKQKEDFFKKEGKTKKYLLEFVSANPTGPLHLGHGRGGIIGDVIANVLKFFGHTAEKEFYINDAGSQIKKLGNSLKIRVLQELGKQAELPEDGYAGTYLIDLAKECIKSHGKEIESKITESAEGNAFFETFAKEKLLAKIKETLTNYGIHFDSWFSELQVHKKGLIEEAVKTLLEKNLAYEQDGAIWFKSTEFGDDKDRVIRKKPEEGQESGAYTYIAADIAYHKEKFDRGYDVLIDILGQDHHGYVKRLKGTMTALGYDAELLNVILYQLVSIKQGAEQVKMSKRAGTFEKLSDVIEKVGTDVARFFYLNRKAEAHLEFDLETALKKTEENPAYYIQYAYVRTNSLLAKAAETEFLKPFVNNLSSKVIPSVNEELTDMTDADISVLKKICSLSTILETIETTYQTHLLTYYTLELAKTFHNYYAHNKIIDLDNLENSKRRLLLTKLIQETLAICLDLLGLSKPKRM